LRLDTFFENFGVFMDIPHAPDGIRELILQLAVRGKLTSQDSTESAESQLSLANSFRAQRGRKDYLNPEDVPFLIPESWKWIAIGDTMELINGKAFKSEEWSTEGTPIIRIQNLNNENATFNRCKIDVDPKVHVNDGEFLISWSGTPGTSFGAFIWNRGFAYLNQHIFRCELAQGVFVKEFLRFAVNARLDEMISHAQGGVGLRHITKGKLENIYLPLPPLAEQRRIVTKVNQMTALCDRLEVDQKEREVQHIKLSRATIARFDAKPTPGNLDAIFDGTYPATPADLRKAILNLAVQGKITYQDPNEESGSMLLERMLGGSSNQGRHTLPSTLNSNPAELPFPLPAGWAIASLGSILQPSRGISYGIIKLGPEPQSGGVNVLRCSNVRFRRLDLAGVRKVAQGLSEEYGRTVLRGGEVLINVRGTLGGCAVVPPSLRGYNIAREVAVIPVHSEVDPAFLLNVIASPYFQERVNGNLRGIAYEGLNLSLLRDFPIPIPPRGEQQRIVAKIDQLMGVVEQLDELLREQEAVAHKLLDAIVGELLRPDIESTESISTRDDLALDRALIGCYVIQHLGRSPNFGRTMLMKVLYLSEAHVGISQGWEPMRQAAGPYDPAVEDFESVGVRSGWFTVKTKTLGNGHEMVQYEGESGMEAKIAEAVSVLGGRQTEFDRLLSLFQRKTTEEAEIIATLFAAWNDMLIDGKSPSDDEIIREVRENWHYKKERFTPTLLTSWLNWLRQQNVIPRGLAPRTRQQLKLGLS
jgi:type I restriction enzyme, S subunit